MAYSLEKQLFEMGATVVLLDGSSVRSGLSKELDFTPTDRAEHLRRVAEVCRILNDQGIITIGSFISPDDNIRQQIAKIIGEERFHLFYMEADLGYCKTTRPDFYGQEKLRYIPGVDLPFDVPLQSALTLDPHHNGKNPEKIINYCREQGIFPL
jgi:adenylylsulfate kinase-like enzyme